MVYVHLQQAVHLVQTPSFNCHNFLSWFFDYFDYFDYRVDKKNGESMKTKLAFDEISTHQALLSFSNGQPWSLVSENLKIDRNTKIFF